MQRFKIAFVALAVSFSFATDWVAHAQSSLDQGIALYQRESNDEAEQALKKAREEEPASTRAAYYLGLTYKRLQRYSEAEKQLKEAVNNEPRIKEALLELVEVQYQLGKLDEAQRHIEVAEREGIRPAQAAFLNGLVQLKRNRPNDAIESFRKARDLDASLKQAADYQIGIANLQQKSWDEAAKAFQEVLVLDPNTDIGAYAREYVKAIERQREAYRPWKLNLGFFGEYDDNVVLKPADTTVVQDVGDESDFREVVTLDAEYAHRFSDRFGMKAHYNLYFANQEDLDRFDVNSHTLGVTPSWQAGSWSFSVPTLYNYTWVDDEDFLATITVNPIVNIRTRENQVAQVGVKLQDKNFLQSPVLADEDRDAFRVAPGAAYYWFFFDNNGFFGGRYEYDVENTEGANWDYDGHRVNLSLQWPFTEKLKGTLAGEVYFQEFDNTHTIFGTKRDDDTYTVSALLSYAIIKKLELQLRYTYVNHDSNLALYDYGRNVYGAGLVYRF